MSAVLELLGADRGGSRDDLDLAVAWTAHELRGPLVGVRAVLEILRERDRSTAEEALLDRCLVELDQLSGLVDDILRWGVRGDAPRPRRCDIVRVVEESLEQCRLELGEGRVSLQAPPRAVAWVEPVQLRGAVGNLVRNALMYSPGDSSVEVVVEIEVGSIIVRVRNAGPDIPPGEGETIFLPFVRGTSSDGQFGGGLGLFITRRVAEANGGRLSFTSENGTTEFRLEIPREGA